MSTGRRDSGSIIRMRVLALSGLCLFGAAGAAIAQQPTDHLQCHKIKDANRFRSATVDLASSALAFDVAGECVIKGVAKQVCVAVAKTVVSTDADGSPLHPETEAQTNSFLCYKMKCPKQTIPDTLLTDQFGEREATRLRAARQICVPAVEGVVTTSTSTSTTTSTSTSTTLFVVSSSTTSTSSSSTMGGTNPTVTTSTITACPATSSTTTSLASTIATEYDVTVQLAGLPSGNNLATLQFDLDYSAAPGGFAGSASPVDCTALVGGVIPSFSDADAGTLHVGLVSLSGFGNPVCEKQPLVRCTFARSGPNAPEPADFAITVFDASRNDLSPVVPLPTLLVQPITARP